MNVGSLFSGIGGFDLGLERAGMRIVWQCEANEYRRAVLRKHWPGIPCFEDVQGVGYDAEWVDLICGGFPCQDISSAGAKVGIGGKRSGLWAEFARIIGELRPRYVLVENVSALLARGLGVVLADLAALGYDAEWDCLPASAFGAPHRRDRVWVIAYPNGDGESHGTVDAKAPGDAGVARRRMGNTDCSSEDTHPASSCERQTTGESGWWSVEPHVGRVAHGIPSRVDRLAALGDSLVPQIAEWIGRQILKAEQS